MKTHATLPLSVAFALCLSAVACPGIACAATVNFDVEPTAAQNPAIRLALAADIKDFYNRPEENPSELQHLIRTSYASSCLKNKTIITHGTTYKHSIKCTRSLHTTL